MGRRRYTPEQTVGMKKRDQTLFFSTLDVLISDGMQGTKSLLPMEAKP